MAAKKPKKKNNKSVNKDKEVLDNLPLDIPDEAKKKLEAIKKKLDKFKDKVIEKFEDYIMGVALLPPSKDDKNKEKINVMLLIDDTDSQKMSKEELKNKLESIIGNIAKGVDKNLEPQVLLLSEVWQSCYDGKSDYLQMIAMAAPVFDKGMLAAIKIAEVHKEMVVKKFEKYIVSYVLAGSLVQGRATPESDIDVFIVIDDTDVKKMTRVELKDKLRAIIIGMGLDAGKMTGIENKLNVQVYILTDFWEYIKEASPVIFTFLRDGIPFYDRGIFMPWKQLLQMGRIKPSPEAIDMFKSTGDQMIQRVKYKLKDIGMEDLFYAILTPSQAALMLFGIPPPTPKETPEVLMDVFVNKEKLMEKEYVDILKKVIQMRKELEHGTKKEVTGAELDDLLKGCEKYLERLNKLFKQIEIAKENETVIHNYESVITIMRDVLVLEGVNKVKDTEIISKFEAEVIHKGLMPEKYLSKIKELVKAKKDYDLNKLLKHDVSKLNKDARDIMKFLIEYIQRKRGKELEKTRIRVKYGSKFGEVILLGDKVFIIHDLDSDDKELSKAALNPDGSLGKISGSTMEELEKALTSVDIPPKVFIKEPIFENLKSVFGKDVEILINY